MKSYFILSQIVKIFKNADQHHFKAAGTATVSLQFRNNQYKTFVHFVKNVTNPLWGKHEIAKFGILKRVYHIETGTNLATLQSQFENVFAGFGFLEAPLYTLHLRPDVQKTRSPCPSSGTNPSRRKIEGYFNVTLCCWWNYFTSDWSLTGVPQ